jgi:hypothetical protein
MRSIRVDPLVVESKKNTDSLTMFIEKKKVDVEPNLDKNIVADLVCEMVYHNETVVDSLGVRDTRFAINLYPFLVSDNIARIEVQPSSYVDKYYEALQKVVGSVGQKFEKVGRVLEAAIKTYIDKNNSEFTEYNRILDICLKYYIAYAISKLKDKV